MVRNPYWRNRRSSFRMKFVRKLLNRLHTFMDSLSAMSCRKYEWINSRWSTVFVYLNDYTLYTSYEQFIILIDTRSWSAKNRKYCLACLPSGVTLPGVNMRETFLGFQDISCPHQAAFNYRVSISSPREHTTSGQTTCQIKSSISI